MSVRCPECNHKAPAHAAYCRAGIDESRAPTSADRYRDVGLPGDVVGAFAPDPRPGRERYYPLDRPLPGSLEECDCGHGSQPGEQHLLGCPVEVEWAAEQHPDEPVNLGINPKDIIGSTKTPLGLLPWTALVRVSRVFALGAKKYGAYNWRTPGKPVQHVTYVEAALRHLAAYMDGETLDPESGETHLAHAACGLLILLDAAAIGNAIDNRPTPGLASELMALKP